MRAATLFDRIEDEITYSLFQTHSDLLAHILLMLELYDNHLDQVSGKIKIEERRLVTILNFMGHNLKFINKAYSELVKGYIRIPATLLKTVTEQLIYSLAFAEFPEYEEKYETLGHLVFNRRYPKSVLLKRIGNEGKFFRTDHNPGFWDDVLKKEMYSHLNSLSHPSPDIVFSIMFDESTQKFSKGPKLQDEKMVKRIARLILLCLLFSIIIVDSVFSIKRTSKQDALMKKTNLLLNGALSGPNLR